MSNEPFETYIEMRLPRADDKELYQKLLKVFKEQGKEGLRKYIQNLVDQVEES